MTLTIRTRPNVLSLSDRELQVLIDAASHISSRAARTRPLE